ncbi:MAG: TonB-dependent receptor domain-containing protein [Breznakibacter sp.]
MNRFLFLFLFLMPFCYAKAQQGVISGKVTDRVTGEEIVGAAVFIDGTTIGAATDFVGEFRIANVEAGTYNVKCQSISYEPQIVNAVVVSDGKETFLDIKISSAELKLEEVQVVARVNRQSENMLLMEQKNAVLATQAIGAMELSRKGVGDAEGAVTKVAGISKQEGVKNVFVRGLGDRYNATTFNGFPIPSEDPEYKNVSLDFFSSDIIQSVGVNKVFSADNTADVGGANIDISSKSLMGDGELEVGLSAGGNTQTMGASFLKADGVNGLGFSKNNEGPGVTNGFGFNNSLNPQRQDLQIAQGYSVAGGKRYLLGSQSSPFSFYLVANYNKDFKYVEEVVRNSTTTGSLIKDQIGQKYEINTSHLLMGNAIYEVGKRHKISYNGMMIHTNNQYVGDFYGQSSFFEDVEGNKGLLRRQQVNDNLLVVNQLLSSWSLSQRINAEAGVSYNTVTGLEPDRRINYLSQDGATLVPTKGTGAQQRYFSTLKENDLNAKLALAYKLNDAHQGNSSVTMGYNMRATTDDFEAEEYDLSIINGRDLSDLNLDGFFNNDNLNSLFMLDRNVDKYDVEKYIHSAFADVTYQWGAKWIVNAGLKADVVDLNVKYHVNRGATKGKSKIQELFVLPSLNLKYTLNDFHSLRLGISKTYTLPQSKEISPFRYVGVNFRSQGNPNLKPSENYNVDVKWDYYLTPGELISITGFFKHVANPISRIEIASAGGYLSYENIAKSATIAGIEVEIRKNLFTRTSGSEGQDINKLTMGLNGSYIYSDAHVDIAGKHSQLEGAAPFIANFDLSHNFSKGDRSFTNSLVLNYFSDRIYTIGTQGYQDIVEKGVPTLDFVSSSKLNKHFAISFKARNLLNSQYQLTRDANGSDAKSIVLSEYKKGVNISLGLTYKF